MKIENISFVKYMSIPDRAKYDYYLRYGKIDAFDHFKLGDFTEQTFGFVKDMQEYLNYSGLTWEIFIKEIAKKKSMSQKQVANMGIFHLQQSRIFIKEQIENINKIENATLSHAPSNLEQSAGIDIFDKYRSFIQYDKLSGGDVTKFDEISLLPYGVCLTKLSLGADLSLFNNRLSELQK